MREPCPRLRRRAVPSVWRTGRQLRLPVRRVAPRAPPAAGEAGSRVFVAPPPLYRVDLGKETYWAADDADRDRILGRHQKGNTKAEITRFKGLGEMMPKVLWETTLNPKTRRLLRVDITDPLTTDRVINELMGKDASARFRFIMDRAEEADELDV